MTIVADLDLHGVEQSQEAQQFSEYTLKLQVASTYHQNLHRADLGPEPKTFTKLK